jgi:23S rRNA-/tRNA-specific pseudouridylate synthase
MSSSLRSYSLWREFIVHSRDDIGIRLDRYIVHSLRIPFSLTLKLLRNKRIKYIPFDETSAVPASSFHLSSSVTTVKAKGNERLSLGDKLHVPISCLNVNHQAMPVLTTTTTTRLEEKGSLADRHAMNKTREQLFHSVIFMDDNLLVLNKPYGLATHGLIYTDKREKSLLASKKKWSLSCFLEDLKFDSDILPRLCHRLDRVVGIWVFCSF